MVESASFIGDVSFANFLLFLFVVVFTFVLGSILNALMLKFLKDRAKPIIQKTVSKTAMYCVYALGLYLAFGKIINFNLPAGLAALGILGIGLLLPAVPLLQNIAAGFVLTLERPFKEEDIVEVNGSLCKVRNVMLRKTVFRAFDGRIIILPNILFMTSSPIINYSKGEFIKLTLPVDIKDPSDKEKAIEIIQKICTANPNILPNVPEKKMDRIMKLVEIPAHFFTIPKNVKALTPRVMIRNVNKDKLSLEVWFWIWDVFRKELIISSFYGKLIEEFGKEKIKFG